MPYELFIALRYLRARRRQTAVSVITIIAVAGITAGVAALIFAQALVTGFRGELQDKILAGTAHLNLLRPDNSGLENYRELTDRIRRFPGIRAASATIYEVVGVGTGDRQEMGIIKGVEMAEADQERELLASLVTGDPRKISAAFRQNGAPDAFDGVVPGRDLARLLGVKEGDVITVVSQRTRVTPFGAVPRFTRLRVLGTFAAGLYEYDSKWAYVSLDAARRLTGAGDTAGVIQMKLDRLDQAPEIGRQLLAELKTHGHEGLMTTNWQELNRPLFAALQLQQRVVVIFFLLLMVIAALNIVTTLTMMVVEKQGDIAILRAQGATPRSITRIFVWQGLMIGLLGAGLGTGLGILATKLANVYRLISVPAEIYSLSHITLRLRWTDCLTVALLALAVCLLVTIYPSRKAARIRPSEVLRHE
ncbi:MAG: FtsX-like permease family protein [Blastocatellia bacterium]